MFRNRNLKAKPDSQAPFVEHEHRAIQEEIEPPNKSSFQIARIGPKLLSLLLCTVITVSALLAGYISGDWWPSRCVLALQCLFGVCKVTKLGMEARKAERKESVEKAKRDSAMELPL